MFKYSKLVYYVFLTLAVQILVSCSGKEEIDFFPQEVLDEMYAPFRSSSSAWLSSSSGEQGSSSSTEQSSSSGEQGSSSSTEQSSSSEGSSSSIALSSSGIEQSSSSEALCGGRSYTSSQFCLNNAVTDKCGGTKEYQAGEFCSRGGNVYTLCGKLPYTDDEFCLDDAVTDKCSGITYLNTQFCYDSKSVKDKCGGTSTGDKYLYGTEQCCDSKKYNPTTQFCYGGNKIGDYCETRPEVFDPDKYECSGANDIHLRVPILHGGTASYYRAALIGTQTWMKENLYYNVTGSKCGDGNSLSTESTVNCVTYGRLYDWATAMDLPPKCNEIFSKEDLECAIKTPHQGICPKGWHIPSNADWDTLIAFIHDDKNLGYTSGQSADAGKYLKERFYWESTDNYSFSAMPGGRSGYYDDDEYEFVEVGYRGLWWSSSESEDNSKNAFFRFMDFYEGCNHNVSRTQDPKYALFSIRCVMD